MRRFAAIAMTTLLCACQNGTVTLSVADAPIDGASQVQIRFTGVDLIENDDSKHSFDLDPDQSVNLLASSSKQLLSSVTVPAGDYKQITLHVLGDGSHDISFVTYPSTSPAGTSQTFGLDLPDADVDGIAVPAAFTVTRLRNTALTADIDLRRAIIDANDGDPLVLDLAGSLTSAAASRVVNLVNDEDTGTLSGSVTASLVSGCSTGAIYVFSGSGATLNDVGATAAYYTSTTLPLSSATNPSYSIRNLEAGDYTVAVLCNAAADDPTRDDDVQFVGTPKDVSVSAGVDTQVPTF